jgi:hypothetical protein
VFQVNYLELDAGNRLGSVIHAQPKHAWQTFVISVAPLFVNTTLGALTGLPAAVVEFRYREVNWILFWLAMSVAMHSFPSKPDADQLWATICRRGTPWWLRIVGGPATLLIYVALALSPFWFDAFYAFGVVLGFASLFSADAGRFLWM